jgi:hypothetical protein
MSKAVTDLGLKKYPIQGVPVTQSFVRAKEGMFIQGAEYREKRRAG